MLASVFASETIRATVHNTTPQTQLAVVIAVLALITIVVAWIASKTPHGIFNVLANIVVFVGLVALVVEGVRFLWLFG